MKKTHQQRLTIQMAFQIAGPHTWPAALMPVLLSVAYVHTLSGSVPVVAAFALLVIAVLMQSAVNAFDDYFDFKKGVDSLEDNLEVDDAVLLHNNISANSVKWLAVGFLVVAFLIGIYPVYLAGWAPLAIAIIGAVFVVIYSAGRTPLSYLPVGELASGFVMGGLIMLASVDVMLGYLDWWALLWAVPLIIGIALIMMTNNTCDIEKDIRAKRRTLPVLLGREKSCALYHVLLILWCISIIGIVGFRFTNGIVILPFMLLATYPFMRALWGNPLTQTSRVSAMSQICTVNVTLGAFYAACLLV